MAKNNHKDSILGTQDSKFSEYTENFAESQKDCDIPDSVNTELPHRNGNFFLRIGGKIIKVIQTGW